MTRLKPGRSVRASVILRQIILIPMVITTVLVATLIVLQYRQRINDARVSTLATARALALAVDHQLLEVQVGLQVLASAASLARGDLAQFHERAASLHGQLGVSNFVLLDPSGNQVVNTARPWGTPLPSLGERAPALPVIRTGVPRFFFTNSVLTARPIVVASVPVRIDSEVRYALSAIISLAPFQELLAQQQLPASWIAAIVDAEGMLVARSLDDFKFVGKPAAPAFRQALAAQNAGIFNGRTLEGIDVLTAYSKAEATGWAVGIGIPERELSRTLHMQLGWLAAGVLLVLGLSAALAWFQGRRAVAALLQLVDAAETMGRGERVNLPPLFLEEADRVAAALTGAARKLVARHDEIARNEARWSAVLESATDGIVSVGVDLRIVVYNRAAQGVFGWNAAEVLGQPIRMLLPARLGKGETALLSLMSGAESSPRLPQGLISGLRKSGAVFSMEVSIAQVATPEGRMFTLIVRDASEQEHTEMEVARFARQAAAAREQEKARIARELHDELAQTLSTLKLDARSLEGRVEGALRAKVSEMASMLDQAVAATRRIAADLRPMILDDLGLDAALRWLGTNFAARSRLPCEMDVAGAAGVAEPHATAVFRIVQEALQNVAKHAAASRVSVSVQLNGPFLELKIEDNGKGIAAGEPRRDDAMGILGMEERARLLHGSIELLERPGGGTIVRGVLPLAPGAGQRRFPDETWSQGEES